MKTNLKQIVDKATDKSIFVDLKAFIKFCDEYLNYISDNLQAVIVSQNENHYRFFQYKKEGNFQVTRPINSNLMYDAKNFSDASKEYLRVLRKIQTIKRNDNTIRSILNNVTYTIQQSIGSALDGLPAGQSNTARKLNGDLFEHLREPLITVILLNSGVSVKHFRRYSPKMPSFPPSNHAKTHQKRSSARTLSAPAQVGGFSNSPSDQNCTSNCACRSKIEHDQNQYSVKFRPDNEPSSLQKHVPLDNEHST